MLLCGQECDAEGIIFIRVFSIRVLTETLSGQLRITPKKGNLHVNQNMTKTKDIIKTEKLKAILSAFYTLSFDNVTKHLKWYSEILFRRLKSRDLGGP